VPPVENNHLYKNREKGRVGHMEKSIERRGVESVVKVMQADSKGMAPVGGGEKARATGRTLTQ
jgi:hypothetical protein